MTRLTAIVLALALSSTFAANAEEFADLAASRVILRSGVHGSMCVDQPIASLAVGERRTFDCSMTLPRELQAVISVETYTQDQSDPNLYDNSVRHAVDLETPPDLVVDTLPPRVIDVDLPFPLQIHYRNASNTAATNAVVELQMPAGVLVRRQPAGCTTSQFAIRCAIGNLAPFAFGTLDFELAGPPESPRLVPIAAGIRGDQDDLKPESNFVERETRTFRTFFVTTTADAGIGSLREAIHGANTECGDAAPPTKCRTAARQRPCGGRSSSARSTIHRRIGR